MLERQRVARHLRVAHQRNFAVRASVRTDDRPPPAVRFHIAERGEGLDAGRPIRVDRVDSGGLITRGEKRCTRLGEGRPSHGCVEDHVAAFLRITAVERALRARYLAGIRRGDAVPLLKEIGNAVGRAVRRKPQLMHSPSRSEIEVLCSDPPVPVRRARKRVALDFCVQDIGGHRQQLPKRGRCRELTERKCLAQANPSLRDVQHLNHTQLRIASQIDEVCLIPQTAGHLVIKPQQLLPHLNNCLLQRGIDVAGLFQRRPNRNYGLRLRLGLRLRTFGDR